MASAPTISRRNFIFSGGVQRKTLATIGYPRQGGSVENLVHRQPVPVPDGPARMDGQRTGFQGSWPRSNPLQEFFTLSTGEREKRLELIRKSLLIPQPDEIPIPTWLHLGNDGLFGFFGGLIIWYVLKMFQKMAMPGTKVIARKVWKMSDAQIAKQMTPGKKASDISRRQFAMGAGFMMAFLGQFDRRQDNTTREEKLDLAPEEVLRYYRANCARLYQTILEASDKMKERMQEVRPPVSPESADWSAVDKALGYVEWHIASGQEDMEAYWAVVRELEAVLK